MVSFAEVQTELFSKELPSFEQLKKYKSVIHSSQRNIAECCKQAEAGSNALSCGIALWLCDKPQSEALLKKAKDCALKWMALGCLYRNQKLYDKAIECFETAAKQNAEKLTVILEKAETYMLCGELAKAGQELKRCANFQNVSAEYHYQLGRLADAEGRYEEAMDHYQTAIGLDPSHVQALFQLGYACDLRQDEEVAMDYYRQVVRIAPVHVNALLNLAILHEERREYEKALLYVTQVIKSHPNHHKANLFLKDIQSSMSMVYDEEKEKRKDRHNKILEIPISDFELSVRSRNCLKKMDILTLGDLLRTTEVELLSYKNFGETSLQEIKKILDSKGLRLGMALEQKSMPLPVESDDESANSVSTEMLSRTIEELELSVRARRALAKLGVKNLQELINKTEAELLGCKNFGMTSLSEIKERLVSLGLGLRKLD